MTTGEWIVIAIFVVGVSCLTVVVVVAAQADPPRSRRARQRAPSRPDVAGRAPPTRRATCGNLHCCLHAALPACCVIKP